MLNETLIDTIPHNERSSAPYNTNACACCWSETGPFVAGTTPSRLPIYVCKTCAVTLAMAFGWTSPEESMKSDELILSYQTHVRTLEAQIEAAGQDVDRLAEGIGAKVFDFIAEREKRRPDETAA